MPYPYIHVNQKYKRMNTELVNQAVILFIETLPLEDMSADHPQFHHLYSQECKLYQLMRLMEENEMNEYKRQIADVDSEVGLILMGLNNMIDPNE
jgi:hypothetical protein